MATLDLRDSPRTLVWRRIREAIEGAAELANAGVALSFYDGDPSAISDLDGSAVAALRFLPLPGNQEWYDESRAAGGLVVEIQGVLRSLDAEDVFNLQHALERALDTAGDPKLQEDLVEAGAITGLVLFRVPLRPKVANGVAGQDHLLRLSGSFEITVVSSRAD